MMKKKILIKLLLVLAMGLTFTACGEYSPFAAMGTHFTAYFGGMEKVENKIVDPVRPEARLAVLWIGHATLLIQMDDKIILTDPALLPTVGQFSQRRIEAGIKPENLPDIDLLLISHVHIDHFNTGSIQLIEDKIDQLLIPEGGLIYMPDYPFPMAEIAAWRFWEKDGIKITALPTMHNGMRYGLDILWRENGYGSFMIEYHGMTVYFAGDTGYNDTLFKKIGEKFENIDLAILPMAPIHPASSGVRHTDPVDALKLYRDLQAKWMLPMHYETFPENFDTLGEVSSILAREMKKQSYTSEQIIELKIGEQRVLIDRD